MLANWFDDEQGILGAELRCLEESLAQKDAEHNALKQEHERLKIELARERSTKEDLMEVISKLKRVDPNGGFVPDSHVLLEALERNRQLDADLQDLQKTNHALSQQVRTLETTEKGQSHVIASRESEMEGMSAMVEKSKRAVEVLQQRVAFYQEEMKRKEAEAAAKIRDKERQIIEFLKGVEEKTVKKDEELSMTQLKLSQTEALLSKLVHEVSTSSHHKL
eukprot:749490-Hanusia_phi.AAC.2